MAKTLEEKSKSLGDPTYQAIVDLGVKVPKGLQPLTAEYFVAWLILYHGLPEDAREVAVSNLKDDYARVKLQGSLEHAAVHPSVVVHNHFSLFGKK